MLYHGAQRVKLPNLSKISRLLSPLATFLRFQAFQRYMISDVVFRWLTQIVVTLLLHYSPLLRSRGEAGKGGLWAKAAINDILIVACCMKY